MKSYNCFKKHLINTALFFIFAFTLHPSLSFAQGAPDCGLNVGSIQVGDLHTLGIDFDPGDVLNKFACQIFVVYTSEIAAIMVRPAKNLLFILLSIDIIWTGINWILDETDLQAIVGTFVKKIIYIGLIAGLINNAGTAAQSGNLMDNSNWIATLPNSFVAIGNDLAQSVDPGASNGLNSSQVTIGNPYSISANPGAIMNHGILIGFKFLLSVLLKFLDLSSILPWNILGNFLIFIVAILVTILIIMMFGLMASDMLVNYIEAYITMAVGILLLGFAGSRWTMASINVFLAYMIGLGCRMLLGIAVYAISVKILQDAIDSYGGVGGGINAAWGVVINTFGTCFMMFMVVNKVPDISAGMNTTSPMLSAGVGLKTAVSSLQGGLKGAALGSQVLGAGMQGLGQRMTGKIAWSKGSNTLKPKVSAKAEERVAPPKKEDAKKKPNQVSGLDKDVKTAAKNLTFRKGSALRNATEAFKEKDKTVVRVDGSKQTVKKSFGERAKAAGGSLARSAGAKENSSTLANTGNVAKTSAGRTLNTLGKVANFAGRSMDGGKSGNFLGKALGGTLSKVSKSGYLDDKALINYLSTIQIDMPE